MRTRTLPTSTVRHVATPGAPGCEVGSTRDQSIDWNGMPSSFIAPHRDAVRAGSQPRRVGLPPPEASAIVRPGAGFRRENAAASRGFVEGCMPQIIVEGLVKTFQVAERTP